MGNSSDKNEEKKIAQYLDELKNERLDRNFLIPKNEFEIILTEMERRGIAPKIYEEENLIRKRLKK